MSDQTLPVRPPVFATVDVYVYAEPDAHVRVCVGGTSFVLTDNEARALCTAMRDALDADRTPTLRPR